MLARQADLAQLEDRLTRAFMADFEVYAEKCLKIRPKDGQELPLKLNRSQKAIHDKCEDMLRRKGRVRLVVLKSRQVGISTYVAGRHYYKITFRRGFRGFILTHLDETTDALFGMIKRFHDGVPDFVRPVTGASNAKELTFSKLDGGYLVSTAGNKGTGRGHTNQIFHGSEVSRWQNATEHIGGVLESIPDKPDTEIILESTANGIGNVFHKQAMDAMAGVGEFEFIFVPWFWHEEYVKPLDESDWQAPGFLAEYAELHGLTREQTYWAYLTNIRLSKLSSGRSDQLCWMFRQEYPADANEAFQSSGSDTFIPADVVMKARKATGVTGTGPIVLGIDVARGGEDKSALIDRQGRVLGGHVCERTNFGKDTTALVSHVIRIVKDFRLNNQPLRKVILDASGVGGPVYDVLREQLGPELVAGVEFGGGALLKNRYANRRAEIWDLMRQWLQGDVSVRIRDDDLLQRDLCAPAWGPGATRFRTTDSTLVIEDKERMRARLKFSPDYGDAAALTFALSFDQWKGYVGETRPALADAGAWML